MQINATHLRRGRQQAVSRSQGGGSSWESQIAKSAGGGFGGPAVYVRLGWGGRSRRSAVFSSRCPFFVWSSGYVMPALVLVHGSGTVGGSGVTVSCLPVCLSACMPVCLLPASCRPFCLLLSVGLTLGPFVSNKHHSPMNQAWLGGRHKGHTHHPLAVSVSPICGFTEVLPAGDITQSADTNTIQGV